MSISGNILADPPNPARADIDRRAKPTAPVSRYWLFGRRRAGRRDGEADNIYVDRYTRGEWFLIVGVLILSLLDMVFTIIHLNAGGTEANPVMAWILDVGGHSLFIAAKLFSTVVGLLVLLVHVRVRRVHGLLVLAFLLYSGILFFHLYLAHHRLTGGGL